MSRRFNKVMLSDLTESAQLWRAQMAMRHFVAGFFVPTERGNQSRP